MDIIKHNAFLEYRMSFERIRRATYIVALIIGVTLVAYVFMKHVFFVILPFLIAWFVAFLMRPLSVHLSARLKIKPNIVRLFLTVGVIAVLIGLSALGVWLISRELKSLIERLGEGGAVEDFITRLTSSGGLISRIFGDFSEYVSDVVYNITMSLLSSLGGALSTVVSLVPKALLFILITVISCIYFALDLERINYTAKKLLPQRIFTAAVRLKDGFLKIFAKYIRSYILLMLITFGEMVAGLFILRAPYPILLAAVIAVLDLLPVIGVGTVLLPWAVWCFISGNTPLGIGLSVLFVFHSVLREILEPKILGKNLGVHPILTLIILYVGYSVFGFMGLLLVPVLTVLLNIALGEDDSSKVA